MKDENSIFLKYIVYTKNNAEKYLTASCVKDIKIPTSIIEILISKKWIRKSGTEAGMSHITGHGVTEIEKDKLIEKEILVNYFDKKKFSFNVRTAVKDQEKLRLFTMLATKTFF